MKPKKRFERLLRRIKAYEAWIAKHKMGSGGYRRPGSTKK